MLHDPPARSSAPAPVPAALRPGEPRTIGPFRVRSRLGSGGMGDVYLGSTRKGQQVAIKLIRGAQLDDDEFRIRFRREVRAAAKVRSRFIANLVDADPEADLPWLATEYVAGPTLSQELAVNGPLPQADVLNLVTGVAEALHGIHRAGLVHRDVKPANVILGPDGPRLIDLGVVAAADATRLTLTGQAVGTPMYMAPEQATGSRVTAAADVWALGALAYYAATGNHLFEGDHPAVVLYRVSAEDPSYADSPEYLRAFLDALLVKDPERRPPLDAILRSLGVPDQAVEATLPVAGPPDPPSAGTGGRGARGAGRGTTTSGRATAAARPGRRRTRVVVGAATAAMLLAGSAFGVWSWLDDDRERNDLGGAPVTGQPQENAPPEDLTDTNEPGVSPGTGSSPVADGSAEAPWALGTSKGLGGGSCWIVSIDRLEGRLATLTVSCDRAGTSEYGTPTPSEWLAIYAVGADGTSERATREEAGPEDTFWAQGNLTDPTAVTTTVTLPDVGELTAVYVENNKDHGWSWAATG